MHEVHTATVVENAIRYGMRPDDRTLHIIIRTQSQDDNILNIIVQDDGVGIDEAQQQVLHRRLSEIYEGENDEMSFGVGLYNVNNQLVLRYGRRCQLRIYSAPGQGTTIVLPISTKDEVCHAEDSAGR